MAENRSAALSVAAPTGRRAAGNTPRVFLRGPSQQRVDLSLAKRIPLRGRVSAELWWEVFNLLNTVNFALPENNFGGGDFGTITSTVGGPRVSQFGVRVTFEPSTGRALSAWRAFPSFLPVFVAFARCAVGRLSVTVNVAAMPRTVISIGDISTGTSTCST